jgi:hypothetical protein
MMEMIKKIALRILMLLVVITICNYIYVFTTYKTDLHAEGNVLLKFERALESADALYFSASPNAAIAKTDTDQRTIAQMMDDLLPDIKLEAVDTGGIHAGVYKKLVELIPEKSPVKYVVINMNYRSFGIDWIESDLENSIQKQLVFYHNRPAIVSRFLQGLNYYETKTTKERKELIQWHWQHDSLPFAPPRNNVTDWCAMEKWGDWTNPKRQLADSYIKNFAFTITEENPRLKDFDEIVQICHSKNLQLIFVILPENMEEGEILAGSELTNLMRSNKDQLVKRYRDKGVTVVDCLDSVPDSCFIERVFPSEHYNQFGRMTVAKAVTDALK